MQAFMQQAGLDGDALRKAVGSPRLTRGLIDYFAANEGVCCCWLCANTGTRPRRSCASGTRSIRRG